MEFIVSSTELINQLNLVKGVINSKNTLPILDNFLFVLDDNKLKITSSDLETTLDTEIILTSAKGKGVIAIEAKRLTDIIKQFSEQPLTFVVDTESFQIDILTQNGKFSIKGQDGEEFPKVPSLQKSFNSMRLPASVLSRGINNTLFATADDELRPVMNGILMEISEDYLRMVASDAHKLVKYTRTDVKAEKSASFILPKKTSNILKSILSKENEDVLVEFDSKNAFFTLSNYKLVCRLVEGKYPNYNAVIPQNNPNKLTIDRVDFFNTVKRVSICANQASNLSKLSIDGNEIIISAQDIDFSISGVEKLNCQYDGDKMDIGFKSAFLIDILSNLKSENILMEMSEPSRAGIITPVEVDDKNEEILMLIMPMMV